MQGHSKFRQQNKRIRLSSVRKENAAVRTFYSIRWKNNCQTKVKRNRSRKSAQAEQGTKKKRKLIMLVIPDSE